MGIYNRADGKIVINTPTLNWFFPFLMRSRTEATIYYSCKINLNNTLTYMCKHNVKLFHIFIAALVRLGVEHKNFNRFVSGKRIYQRNNLSAGFIATQTIGEMTSGVNVKVFFEKTDKLSDVVTKVSEKVNVLKKGSDYSANENNQIDLLRKFPIFVTTLLMFFLRLFDNWGLLPTKFINENPLFVSAYLANTGSIGLDAPFHHLFEFGNASLFIILGKIYKDYVIDDDGKITVADMVSISFSIDERIIDGAYMSKGLDSFKKYMENPSLLE